MRDRLIDRIIDMRYGNIGVASAIGAAFLSISWTILNAAGVAGSAAICLSLLYGATVLGFLSFIGLRSRKHRREVQRASLPGLRIAAEGRSRTIAVVAPISFWSTEYYVRIIRGIREAAERSMPDHRRRLAVMDVPHEEFLDVEETLADGLVRSASGVILINMRMSREAKVALAQRGVPAVAVNDGDDEAPITCSVLHDHSGFAELVEHGLVQKHASAAVLVTKELRNALKGVDIDASRKEKRDVFTAASTRAGLIPQKCVELDTRPVSIQEGQAYILEVARYDDDSGARLLSQVEGDIPVGTTIVFLADVAAIGFIRACSENGRSPRERGIRVTGYDNTAASKWFDLSTVDYQLDVVGRVAYDRLQAALDFPGQLSHTTETIQTICYIRGSSEW